MLAALVAVVALVVHPWASGAASTQPQAGATATPPKTELISADARGSAATQDAQDAVVSAGGRYVAFASRARLDPLADGNTLNVYVRDLVTERTALISRGGVFDARGRKTRETEANGDSSDPSISADGRYVAFESYATNLTAPATSGANQTAASATSVVVADRDVNADGHFDEPAVSGAINYPYVYAGRPERAPDGSETAAADPKFDDDATSLAWLKQPSTSATRSHAAVTFFTKSSEGRLTVASTNDIAPQARVYISPEQSQTYISHEESQIALSGDGHHLVMQAMVVPQSNPTATEQSAILDVDPSNSAAERLDTFAGTQLVGSGSAAGYRPPGGPVNAPTTPRFGDVSQPAVSRDGRMVAFTWTPDDAQEPGPDAQVVVIDRDPQGAGQLAPGTGPGELYYWEEVASDKTFGSAGDGWEPALSEDGRYLSFVTAAAGMDDTTDTPMGTRCMSGAAAVSTCDVVVRDLVTDRRDTASTLAKPSQWPRAELATEGLPSSCPTHGVPCDGNGNSGPASMDRNGSEVVFASEATNLVDPAGPGNTGEIYVRRFQPVLDAKPAKLAFETAQPGDTADQSVTLTYSGFGPLPMGHVTISGGNAADFTVDPTETCTGRVLYPRDSCVVSVSYKSATTGDNSAALSVTATDGRRLASVALSGTTKAAPIPPAPPVTIVSMGPSRIDFGTRLPLTTSSAHTVRITDKGNTSISIGSIGPLSAHAASPGADPQDFAVVSNGCAGHTLRPGQSCAFGVTATPRGGGTGQAVFQVASPQLPSPLLLQLAVTGVTPTLAANPAVGPPGQVTQISGSGFPPNKTVTVGISGRTPRISARTGAVGNFTATLLIYPDDSLGPGQVVATLNGAKPVVTAGTQFVVTAGTLQPPGFIGRR